MISKKLALELNQIIAEFSGGTSGIRDEKLLLSALNRPFQTFDKKNYIRLQLIKRLPFSKASLLTIPLLMETKGLLMHL